MRIDTHSHFVPPFYRAWLESQPAYPGPFVDWSSAQALEFLDANDIATGILSISTPGVRMPRSEDFTGTRALARQVNEYSADVARENPGRFGFFATVTLPDVDGAIAEAEYALDVLGADGIVLMTNTDGSYVGSTETDPLLEFLNTRAAVVFLHPTPGGLPGAAGLPAAIVDFLTDSVRAAITLVRNDSLVRYRELKVLLAHGGGYLPYAALRIAMMALPGVPLDEAIARLQGFYFDTAVTAGPYALPSLLEFAADDHVTFGSDWPYANGAQAALFTAALDKFPISKEWLHSINRGAADLLFPQFSRKVSQ